MKKIILILAVALISTTLSAQKQSTVLKPSQLPVTTQNFIKDNLPGCQIFRAVKVVENGKTIYNVGVDVKGKKNLFIFDGNGAFLKRGDTQEETNFNTTKPDANKDQRITPANKGKDVQPESSGDVKIVTDEKGAQPASTHDVKKPTNPKVAQPVSGSTKPVQSKTLQPATSGAVQQTGSKDVKLKGTVSDKKPAPKSGADDLTQPKK